MKTARLQVLTTPAFRDWLRKEAKREGVSVGELVRTRCEGNSGEEEKMLAELTAQLRKEVRRAQASIRSGIAEADSVLKELRAKREQRLNPERRA
jgi:hypothetical protein